MDYLTNVVLTFSTYVFSIGAILLLWWITYKVTPLFIADVEQTRTVRKLTNKIASVLVVVSVVVSVLMSVFSPALTYKNQTLNVEQETAKYTKQIEQEAASTKDKPIVETIRQPKMTDEERQRDFDETVDWRNR